MFLIWGDFVQRRFSPGEILFPGDYVRGDFVPGRFCTGEIMGGNRVKGFFTMSDLKSFKSYSFLLVMYHTFKYRDCCFARHLRQVCLR